MKKTLAAALIGASLFLVIPTASAQLQMGVLDTVESVLNAQKGKRVTLRLRSGQELTGVVRLATPKVVQLGEIQGREFFDAVVPLDAVEAVLVRVKQ